MKVEPLKYVPAQAYCKRCGNLFCYFKYSKPRMYCVGCAKQENLDNSRFRSAWYRIERIREKERRRIKQYPPR